MIYFFHIEKGNTLSKKGFCNALLGPCPLADLPERYPPYQTCHRHFKGRVCESTLGQISPLSPKTSRNGED